MITIITTFSYIVCAAIVVFFMANETNKKMLLEKTAGEPENKKKYTCSGYAIGILLLLLVLSGLSGYIVSTKVTSIIGIIEVGVCFFAVLGAAVIDLKLRVIPNFIPFSLVIIRLFILVYEFFFVENAVEYLISSLVGGFLCVVMLSIANKIVNEGIGGGDIKLLAAIGFVCGIYVVFSVLLIALVVCTCVSGILLFFKKKTKKDHIPFGPFIFVGYLIMCLFTLY